MPTHYLINTHYFIYQTYLFFDAIPIRVTTYI